MTAEDTLIDILKDLIVTMEETSQLSVNMESWVYDADTLDEDEQPMFFSMWICGVCNRRSYYPNT